MNLNGVGAATLLAPHADKLAEAVSQIPNAQPTFQNHLRNFDTLFQNPKQATAAAAIQTLAQNQRMDLLAGVMDNAGYSQMSGIDPNRNNGLEANRSNLENIRKNTPEQVNRQTSDDSGLATASNEVNKVPAMLSAVDAQSGRQNSNIQVSPNNTNFESLPEKINAANGGVEETTNANGVTTSNGISDVQNGTASRVNSNINSSTNYQRAKTADSKPFDKSNNIAPAEASEAAGNNDNGKANVQGTTPLIQNEATKNASNGTEVFAGDQAEIKGGDSASNIAGTPLQANGTSQSSAPVNSDDNASKTAVNGKATQNNGQMGAKSTGGIQTLSGIPIQGSTDIGGGFNLSTPDNVMDSLNNKFNQDLTQTQREATINTQETKGMQASALRAEIEGNPISEPSLGHQMFGTFSGGDLAAAMNFGGAVGSGSLGILQSAAAGAQSAAEFSQYVNDNPESAMALQKLTAGTGAGAETLYEWAKNGFDSDQTLTESFQNNYQQQVIDGNNGIARSIDESVGAVMMFSGVTSGLIDPHEGLGADVREMASSLSIGPRQVAERQADQYGLTTQEQGIFGEAVMSGLFGNGNLDEMRTQYHASHENSNRDQEFIDKKFDTIVSAATAGDQADNYLMRLGAYNEANEEMTPEELNSFEAYRQ
jgi:hypothetical protein